MIYGTVAENTIIWFKLVLHQNAAKTQVPLTRSHTCMLALHHRTQSQYTHIQLKIDGLGLKTVFGILVFSLPSCRSSISISVQTYFVHCLAKRNIIQDIHYCYVSIPERKY